MVYSTPPTVSTSSCGQNPDNIHAAENHCCCEGYKTRRRWYVVANFQQACVSWLFKRYWQFLHQTAILNISCFHLRESPWVIFCWTCTSWISDAFEFPITKTWNITHQVDFKYFLWIVNTVELYLMDTTHNIYKSPDCSSTHLSNPELRTPHYSI